MPIRLHIGLDNGLSTICCQTIIWLLLTYHQWDPIWHEIKFVKIEMFTLYKKNILKVDIYSVATKSVQESLS